MIERSDAIDIADCGKCALILSSVVPILRHAILACETDLSESDRRSSKCDPDCSQACERYLSRLLSVRSHSQSGERHPEEKTCCGMFSEKAEPTVNKYRDNRPKTRGTTSDFDRRNGRSFER